MRKFKFESIAKILLVTGNKEDADVLTEIVSSTFDIIYAYDDVRALATLMNGQNSFSTIIVDEKNAVPLLRTIRKNPILKSLPVIISIESNNYDIDDELLDLDVIYFLKKPYNKNQVISRIKNTVQLYEASKAITELERDELTDVLAKNNINMKAISLADTSDFGIARIIVDNPDEVAKMLEENEYLVKITSVIAIEIPDESGSLSRILKLLAENNRNVEYMYGFTGRKTSLACMIIRCTDIPETERVLDKSGIRMMSQAEIEQL